jgi:hypothetical protein
MDRHGPAIVQQTAVSSTAISQGLGSSGASAIGVPPVMGIFITVPPSQLAAIFTKGILPTPGIRWRPKRRR